MKLEFNPEEIEHLRRSFLQLIPAADALAENLYAQMFKDHPEVRPYFKPDVQSQQDKLIETLATLLDLLDNPAAAEHALRELGQRHTTYGATAELYHWVEKTILEKLLDGVPQGDGEELSELWHRLMSGVTTIMLEGALPVSEAIPADVE